MCDRKICPKHGLALLRYFRCDAPNFRKNDAKMTAALDNAQLWVLRGKNDLLLHLWQAGVEPPLCLDLAN